MRLIRAVEAEPRGIYTGGMGTIEPAPGQLGWRLRLSVAIRTLELAAGHCGRLGIGGGIVADSTAAAEWQECLLQRLVAGKPEPRRRTLQAIQMTSQARVTSIFPAQPETSSTSSMMGTEIRRMSSPPLPNT
jgi:para-aminobenzoate synthetase/4-amino-4-deoxychorismate lyase